MTDFHGMSTYLGLFYAKRSGNHIHCIFIFTVFVSDPINYNFYTDILDLEVMAMKVYSIPTLPSQLGL